jgi:hypothetical protein
LRRVPDECNTGIKLLQRLLFLDYSSLRLCPVFFNGKMILPGQGRGDLAGRVAAMLAEANLPEYSW